MEKAEAYEDEEQEDKDHGQEESTQMLSSEQIQGADGYIFGNVS